MDTQVNIARDSEGASWESYLDNRSISYHAYSWAWREIIHTAFTHKPYYLIAKRNQSVVGVLPLFVVKSFLFGKALISLPYLNGGGILASDEEAGHALFEKASSLSRELAVRYVELRHREQLLPGIPNLELRQHKVSMVLDLSDDPQKIFSSFPAKLRSQIRRPSKDGVTLTVSGDTINNQEALDSFYQVFSSHMRDLGTPVYSKKLFFSVKEHFKTDCRVLTTWYKGQPIAAGITIKRGEHSEIPWASSLRKYNRLSPNMLLYWGAIKSACLDGCSSFDFGRSSYDSTTFNFKKQWGAKPLPLHWYYLLEQGEIPDVNPRSPKYTLFVNFWRHLPLAVTNSLGPWLTRSLP